MKLSRKLQLLETPLQEDIWRMHQARLGYMPETITCNFLKDSNLIINIERSRSPTEQFLLRQGKLQLAQDVGVAINQILKREIASLLKDSFELPVTECSFLTPASIGSFSLWIAMDSEKIANMGKPERLHQSSMTDSVTRTPPSKNNQV